MQEPSKFFKEKKKITFILDLARGTTKVVC